jgi:2-keto-4-pentenoate hydratase
MAEPSRIESDARELLRQHAQRERFRSAPPPSATTLADAYDLQQVQVQLLRADAGAVAGYKIGLTSPRMQAMCGIAEPVCGAVLARRVHRSGAVLARGEHAHLGLEFEIALRIGRDTAAMVNHNADSVRPHVDGVCAAFELVDDRCADYGALDARALVADNAWNAGVVLSDFAAAWPPLPSVQGRVSIDGEPVDRGYGRDALGDPLAVVAWIANHLAARGECLRAGQFVMTGSLVPTRFPAAPASYRFDLEGIGSVSARVID